MKTPTIRGLAAALAALLAAAGMAASAAPLESYGKLPNIEEAAVSPSGDLMALIATDGEKRTLIVQTTFGRKTLFVGAAGAAKLEGLVWVGEEHLILSFRTTKAGVLTGPRREHLLATDINLRTGKARSLLDNVPQPQKGPTLEVLNVLDGPPQVRKLNGKPQLFVYASYWNGAAGGVGVFNIDLDHAGEARLWDDAGETVCQLLLGPDGRAVAMATCDDRTRKWSLKVKSGSSTWRTAEKAVTPIDIPSLIGLTPDGDSALVAFRTDDTTTAWRQISLATAAWKDPVTTPNEKSPILDAGRMIGEQALVGDEYEVDLFDPRDAAIWRGVAKAFPGDRVAFESWSDDHRKIIARVDSAELGPAFALVDLSTGEADWIGAEYAGLKAQDISPVRPIRYQAADGLQITGYLTLPRGREAKNLPLVVLPHGGPGARDAPGFDWLSQAIASRGYAVLRPNFRGSSGFGEDFKAAGFGQFGRKMQTDLSDGVRDLAREGVIDPKRVCIVGASYGGYAALAGAVFDPGVYRCAVAYAGMADLRADLKDTITRYNETSGRYWLRYYGAKSVDDPVLNEISPVAHADRVHIPILLIHGRDDTVVDIAQSHAMAAALRRAGKPVELVELPGEDHWLSRGETRLQMLQATVAFLEKNNPPN